MVNKDEYKTVFIQQEFTIRQLVIMFSCPKTVKTVFRGFRREYGVGEEGVISAMGQFRPH